MKKTILLFLTLFYSILSFSQVTTGNLVFATGSSTVCQGTVVQLNLELDIPSVSSFYRWSSTGAYAVHDLRPGIIEENNGGSGVGDEHSFIRLTLNEVGVTTISVTVQGFVYNQEISVVKAPNAGRGTTTVFNCNLEETIDLFNYLVDKPDTGGVWTLNDQVVDGIFDSSIHEVGIYTYTISGNFPCSDSQATVIVRNCSNNDHDNDGVPNDIDLDDDNDGILDTIENSVCSGADLTGTQTIYNNDFGEGDPTEVDNVSENLTYEIGIPQDVNGNDGEYNVATSTYLYNFGNQSAFYISTDENNFWDGDNTVNGRFLSINMKTSSFVNEILYEVQDLVVTPGITHIFNMKVVNLSEGIIPTFKLQIIAQSGAIVEEIESNTSDLQNIDIWNKYVIEFVPSAGIENIGFRIVNTQSQSGNGNNIGIDNISLKILGCDIDNDDIPNYLDLDSDNDGILDFVEAGLNQYLDANNDGVLDGSVDFNGVPLVANGGIVPVDTNLNNVYNFLDLDSDNDSIFDTIEAGLDPSLDANNDGVVDGEVDENGVPLAVNGGLTVVDENGNGIPDYLDADVTLSTIVNVLEEKKYTIYPNPVSEKLFINSTQEIETISIYNLEGALIQKENIGVNNDVYELNISNLTSGIYFLRIDKENTSSKFIVE